MITRPQPAHTLPPGFMLAACVAFPAAASAQTPPPTTGSVTLSAAMAEALQSPFHAARSGTALPLLHSPAFPLRNLGGQEAPDSAGGLRAHHFLPILAATVASDFLMLWGVAHGRGAVKPLVGIAASILAPAGAAALAGGSFNGGVGGSLAGLGAGLLAASITRAWFVIPIPHAIMTMWLASWEWRSARNPGPLDRDTPQPPFFLRWQPHGHADPHKHTGAHRRTRWLSSATSCRRISCRSRPT